MRPGEISHRARQSLAAGYRAEAQSDWSGLSQLPSDAARTLAFHGKLELTEAGRIPAWARIGCELGRLHNV